MAIVFGLLDDVMANWLWLQGLQCFTARADIRYRSELAVGTLVSGGGAKSVGAVWRKCRAGYSVCR